MVKPVEQKTWRALFTVGLMIFIAAFYLGGESFQKGPAQILALFLLAAGYVGGVLAGAVHALLLLIGFVLSLPIISALYAAAAGFIARLHYILFKSLFKRGVKQTSLYRRGEEKVRGSRVYQALSQALRRILKGLGLHRPRQARIFEVERCPACNREIPSVGSFCPFCGAVRDREKAPSR
ncbi:MAG: zinc ribbon domain-containing protein [Methanobacteriota archaeon]|nr:MAG: zinc ribbon domain-containing protein [Euryarchaeota archaeon]